MITYVFSTLVSSTRRAFLQCLTGGAHAAHQAQPRQRRGSGCRSQPTPRPTTQPTPRPTPQPAPLGNNHEIHEINSSNLVHLSYKCCMLPLRNMPQTRLFVVSPLGFTVDDPLILSTPRPGSTRLGLPGRRKELLPPGVRHRHLRTQVVTLHSGHSINMTSD